MRVICEQEVFRLLAKSSDTQGETARELAHAITQKISHELTALIERHSQGTDPHDSGSVPLLIVPKSKIE